MFIIDRLEHGNGGVCGSKILDELPLREALKKTPADYGITYKWWGFWPVICNRKKDINNPSFYWDEDEEKWVKADRR